MPKPKHKGTVVELARVENVDCGFEEHGVFTMFGGVNYGGGSQGFGWSINTDFIKLFIRVLGATRLSECNGSMVFVEHSHSQIFRFIPINLSGEKQDEFDIQEWVDHIKKSQENK